MSSHMNKLFLICFLNLIYKFNQRNMYFFNIKIQYQ